MAEPILLDREGVSLSVRVWGEGSPAVLLLHGLAGYAGEWEETAGWLGRHHRVVAFDARGHGGSERAPADVSREAHVADAAYLVEHLGLAPCVVIGQSLGGVTAILLAAARPELVGALVVAEAAPIAPDEATIERVKRWLAGWPVPFPDRAAAVEFFGGPSLWADAWADGLERRDDGWWPRFELAEIVRTLRATRGKTFWREWEAIHCPTLVVAGGNGSLPADVATRMLQLLPLARLESIPEAGHDLHLEQPRRWRQWVEGFVGSLREEATEGGR